MLKRVFSSAARGFDIAAIPECQEAVQLISKGSLSQALPLLDRAKQIIAPLQDLGLHAQLWRLTAKLHRTAAHWKEELKALEAITEKNPQDIQHAVLCSSRMQTAEQSLALCDTLHVPSDHFLRGTVHLLDGNAEACEPLLQSHPRLSTLSAVLANNQPLTAERASRLLVDDAGSATSHLIAGWSLAQFPALYPEAEAHIKTAIRMREKKFATANTPHYLVAESLMELASVYVGMGMIMEAEALFGSAHGYLLSKDTVVTAESLQILARCATRYSRFLGSLEWNGKPRSKEAASILERTQTSFASFPGVPLQDSTDLTVVPRWLLLTD